MQYTLKPIACRPWLLQGLSQKLIESHYENNYGGALRRLNAISGQLAAMDFAKVPPYELNGLKREQLVALNSTLLHELYFASLGGDGRQVPPPMAEALARDFGSVERWRDEFVAMARALAGGSGWVVLTYVPRDSRLINQYAAEHSQAAAGGIPVLALDMYEHAYHIDFGANAGAYIEAFMRNMDWAAVLGRYEDASRVAPPRPLVQPEFADIPAIDPEEVRAMMASGKRLQFIDARPRFYAARSPEIVEGAQWKDPEDVKTWSAELSKSDPVVVYCAYGFHIGCKTAGALRDAGFDAVYMKGGHSALKALGNPLKPLTV
jgi:superoxide dismutase, Fe-Mn family